MFEGPCAGDVIGLYLKEKNMSDFMIGLSYGKLWGRSVLVQSIPLNCSELFLKQKYIFDKVIIISDLPARDYFEQGVKAQFFLSFVNIYTKIWKRCENETTLMRVNERERKLNVCKQNARDLTEVYLNEDFNYHEKQSRNSKTVKSIMFYLLLNGMPDTAWEIYLNQIKKDQMQIPCYLFMLEKISDKVESKL